MSYEWVKVLHIISVISWMAGLLYLPRLFIYHMDAEPGTEQSETFKTMERRLLKAIMTPAMALSWIFGLWLALGYSSGFRDGSLWLHFKLLSVILLSIAHMVLSSHVKKFAQDANLKSKRYFRIINEVPTILMILIVILVVVRPF